MDAREVLRFCPRCGAEKFTSDTGHRFNCAACDFVFFFNNAAAVGVIIESDDGRILVVRRAQDPGAGLLDWPGGFVDPGEGLLDAVSRELQEELGAEVVEQRFLTSHENNYSYRGLTYRTADAFFVATVANIDALVAADDVAAFELVAADQLRAEDFAFVSARHALACYRRT